ncbi:hypothetical protein CKA32_004133 [Geitlerinema sp. FC II]|nr:hypothetical protein CKA32_004133 [Geitlerinema sp. FC II]
MKIDLTVSLGKIVFFELTMQEIANFFTGEEFLLNCIKNNSNRKFSCRKS